MAANSTKSTYQEFLEKCQGTLVYESMTFDDYYRSELMETPKFVPSPTFSNIQECQPKVNNARANLTNVFLPMPKHEMETKVFLTLSEHEMCNKVTHNSSLRSLRIDIENDATEGNLHKSTLDFCNGDGSQLDNQEKVKKISSLRSLRPNFSWSSTDLQEAVGNISSAPMPSSESISP